MNRADGRFVSRPVPRLAAGLLALGVHLLFVLLLVFGVSWQTRHPAPVTVDLWESIPQPPAPRPPVSAPPAPEPPPPAPRPVPEPEVKKEPPPPKAPDIALEKKKAEAAKAAALEKAALEKAAREKAAEEKAAQEKAAREKAAQQKAEQEKAAAQRKRDLLRQMEEEDAIRRMADEEAANQARLLKQAEAKAKAAAGARQSEIARLVGQHRDLISAKVRGNTRLPDNLTGNPEVRCLVRLLPTGEVQSVRVTRSSGNPAYDEAVKRAIEKSSPLPLPADREARAEFVPELSFVHRPKE